MSLSHWGISHRVCWGYFFVDISLMLNSQHHEIWQNPQMLLTRSWHFCNCMKGKGFPGKKEHKVCPGGKKRWRTLKGEEDKNARMEWWKRELFKTQCTFQAYFPTWEITFFLATSNMDSAWIFLRISDVFCSVGFCWTRKRINFMVILSFPPKHKTRSKSCIYAENGHSAEVSLTLKESGWLSDFEGCGQMMKMNMAIKQFPFRNYTSFF